ncbi:MAG: hypothetical protein CL911_04450 [Deltaproteobacteria bacterium]|nr:hypothetical protein [Deltaproteobacteria bacterium]
MKHWLLKSEPNAFLLEDLKNAPNQTECWNGVQNYQARNLVVSPLSVVPLEIWKNNSKPGETHRKTPFAHEIPTL